MKSTLTLIVDDEPDIRELLELTLGRMEIETKTAADIGEAKRLLSTFDFGMCLTDMKLPDGSGIELVQHIQKHYSDVPVAVITAHGNMEMAIKSLKSGAFDFVSKPVNLQMLRNLVNTALKVTQAFPETDRRSRDTLLGDSEVMRKTRATIAKVARSQAPIYISGESGTGKELVAKLIHAKGPRASMPFVPVNCGAIPAELMESELFGHKKGSFTGASSDKPGLFQSAHGGTLFLDEIADLPLHMQVKLLRAIQEKAVRPVGASKEIPVDVRILCATHKSLSDLVAENKFRQDLYYRINVIELKVPPLRDRPEDIPLLAEHILRKIAGTDTVKHHLHPDSIQRLHQYTFPGNVRELENILERALTLCEGSEIGLDDLQLAEVNQPTPDNSDAIFASQGSSTIADSTRPANEAINTEIPLEDQLGNIEKEAIMKALEKTRYNKTAAAKLLGMSFRSLRYRLKKLGLE
ncbi:MAG: sigma-54-dependent transcriptional regulator [Thiohalomonadales bacterium]